MLNLLFHGYHLYGNLYSVALFMSFDAFTRYLHQTSCHIDYEVELCGFNDESAAKCGHCKANRDAVSCEMVHSNSCPYLLSIFPELHDEVNSDILHLMDLGSSYPIVDSEVDCYVKLHCDEGGSSMQSFGSTSPDNFVNSLPTTEDSVPIKKDSLITKGIPLELVSVMLDEALKFAKACHFGQCSQLPSIVHVTSQSQSDVTCLHHSFHLKLVTLLVVQLVNYKLLSTVLNVGIFLSMKWMTYSYLSTISW